MHSLFGIHKHPFTERSLSFEETKDYLLHSLTAATAATTVVQQQNTSDIMMTPFLQRPLVKSYDYSFKHAQDNFDKIYLQKYQLQLSETQQQLKTAQYKVEQLYNQVEHDSAIIKQMKDRIVMLESTLIAHGLPIEEVSILFIQLFRRIKIK